MGGRTAVQIGGVLPYFLRDSRGWGFGNSSDFAKETVTDLPPCYKLLKNEKSAPKEEVSVDGHPADIRGPFARISRPKTSVRAAKIQEKQAFRRGHP